jgi:hypothetical protein
MKAHDMHMRQICDLACTLHSFSVQFPWLLTALIHSCLAAGLAAAAAAAAATRHA